MIVRGPGARMATDGGRRGSIPGVTSSRDTPGADADDFCAVKGEDAYTYPISIGEGRGKRSTPPFFSLGFVITDL